MKRKGSQGLTKCECVEGCIQRGTLLYQDLTSQRCQNRQQHQLPSPREGSQKIECEARSDFAEAF